MKALAPGSMNCDAELLDVYSDAFADFAAELGIDICGADAAEVADERSAARFALAALRNDRRLRRRFPHALSAGVNSGFLRWLERRGAAHLGLSHSSLQAIRAAFRSAPGKRIESIYLNEPTLQELFPCALLPRNQRELVRWLATAGRIHFNVTDEEILWFLQELSETPCRGLLVTYLTNVEWQQRFPTALTWRGNIAFRRWLRTAMPQIAAAARSCMLPKQLPWQDRQLLRDSFRRSRRRLRGGVAGVNILGHFCYPSGLREATLATKRSLERVGLHTSCRDVPAGAHALIDDRTNWLGLELHPVTILTQSPAPFFANGYDRSGLFRRPEVYRIAYWYWELETVPEQWLQLAPLIDEIWAPTQFIARAMRSRIPLPVYHMQPGVEIGEIETVPRSRFGIPDDHYVFLFAFDLNSQIHRKNPHAVVNAFRSAFTTEEKVSLVIKTTAVRDESADLAQLRQSAAGTNTVFIHEWLPRRQAHGLTAMCDCFISLHRSEGFGLGMAEAMLMGKPVIATGYSGNLDFMNSGNSLLVDYELVEIAEDQPIYPRGSFWADPSVEQAAAYMRRVFDDRETAAALGAQAKQDLRTRLSMNAAGSRQLIRLNQTIRRH